MAIAFELALCRGFVALAEICSTVHLISTGCRICAEKVLHRYRADIAQECFWLYEDDVAAPHRYRLPLSLSAMKIVNKAKRLIDPESSPLEGWRTHRVNCNLDEWARDTIRTLVDNGSTPMVREMYWSPASSGFSSGEPLLIKGFAKDWPARHMWDPSYIIDNRGSPLCNAYFKCGDVGCDSGKEVTINLRHLYEYFLSQEDDDPLYVFDRNFADRCDRHDMINDYYSTNGPDLLRRALFGDDLMSLIDSGRPPFRWLLIGPRGSGTAVHRDPPGTVAWNALLKGCKLWALIDPRMEAQDARCGEEFWDDDLPSASWFRIHLPEIVRNCPENMKVMIAVQRPGDVLVVPQNWWHAIWNIEDTIAVTENGVSIESFLKEVAGLEGMCSTSGDLLRHLESCEAIAARVEAAFGLESVDAADDWIQKIKGHFSCMRIHNKRICEDFKSLGKVEESLQNRTFSGTHAARHLPKH